MKKNEEVLIKGLELRAKIFSWHYVEIFFARWGGGYLIPGNIPGQLERGSEQPDQVDVPALCRGLA